MSITAAQLYTLVSEELGLVSGTMPVSADDADKVSRRHTLLRATLIEEGYCYWSSNAIPDAAALPFAMILADKCAEIFGRGPRSEDPYTKGPEGETLLARHCSKRSSKQPITSEYM